MRLLIILSRFPYPLTKGDKLRAFHQIKGLAKQNKIYLFCLTHENVKKEYISILEPFCEKIHIENLSFKSTFVNVLKAFLQGKPLQVGYFFSKKTKKSLQTSIQEWEPERIYCQFIRTFEYVKDLNLPVVLDFQDALSKNMKRQSKTAAFYLKPVLLLESARLQKYECRVLEKGITTTIISEADKNCIQSSLKDSIHVIPNGVDNEYYTPALSEAKKYDILFTGNMSYAPNINAALFLVKKIMPLVWQKLPNAKVLIAGVYPPNSVQALSSLNVEISGWLPDLRTAYASSRIFVAPMQIGTGLQNKLLESMCMGLPCVTSPLANQALMAEHGSQIFIAQSPEEYAESILSLLNNHSLYNELAVNGHHYVVENFSWEHCNEQLEKIVNHIIHC